MRVNLQPIVSNINLPTIIKTAVFPGESDERLFIATQPGEILTVRNGTVRTFLDIRPRVIELGSSGSGYDERGLLGLAFHPDFSNNGLFYLHYSVAGTQGPGALRGPLSPQPCSPGTLNLTWANRETQFDHVDTVEEWAVQTNGRPSQRRSLLNLRRPFMNHNGVNSLNFSPETGNLVLITGDGGSGYDPFNLSRDDMEIAGKIIEIDINRNAFVNNPPAATRFDELPAAVQGALTVIAKGVRNSTGLVFQWLDNRFVKYAGQVGQDSVESIYSFVSYIPIPVTQLVQDFPANAGTSPEGFINFGWRGWEGALPTCIIRTCTVNPALNEKTIAYYNEAIAASAQRIPPFVSYYHEDNRAGKFRGTALTGVQPYMGDAIPGLTRSVVFADLADRGVQPGRGVLAFAAANTGYAMNEYTVIETGYNFSGQPAYYVSLGANRNQTRMYLGVYDTMRVVEPNRGAVFEITA